LTSDGEATLQERRSEESSWAKGQINGIGGGRILTRRYDVSRKGKWEKGFRKGKMNSIKRSGAGRKQKGRTKAVPWWREEIEERTRGFRGVIGGPKQGSGCDSISTRKESHLWRKTGIQRGEKSYGEEEIASFLGGGFSQGRAFLAMYSAARLIRTEK